MSFQKFDLVWKNGGSDVYVILSEKLEVPTFDDFCGSEACAKSFDPTNPKEWGWTFPGYVAWNLTQEQYAVISENALYEKIDPTNKDNGWILFDQSTGKMRGLLALLSIAEKMYGHQPNELVKWLGNSLLKNEVKDG